MPENQNMQKTSDNEAMLQEIVQNTEMGKNTLDELMGLTYDQKLKDEMMRQKNEYRRLNQQAHTALDAIGAQAKGQSAAARMSVSMGIRTRTMLDKSTRNLATMLAEGSGQGVLDCWVSVKQFSKNDTATACQDWLRSTRLGRGSIKSHVRTVKVLGMGLFAFQERIHLWKGVTH